MNGCEPSWKRFEQRLDIDEPYRLRVILEAPQRSRKIDEDPLPFLLWFFLTDNPNNGKTPKA